MLKKLQTGKLGNPSFETLIDLVPKEPDYNIDWQKIWSLWPHFADLDNCPQNPKYHAEGDVGIHTRMVVEALVQENDWRKLPDNEKSTLFWSACLHDIGKPATTKFETDGRITSHGHSAVGAAIARELLWYVKAPFMWREEVCNIVSRHMLPHWMLSKSDPRKSAITTSLLCRANLLCLHAKADVLGRICQDQSGKLENVELAKATFEEHGCFLKAFQFANEESRVAYFDTPNRDPAYEAYEDFSCEVVVMSALPGTGKDTWLSNHRPELPVVSLDEVRAELKIKPEDNQGKVIQEAFAKAKTYLRTRTNFAWNSTNMTKITRSKILRLLRDYNARIHIVYLEKDPANVLKQNASRTDAVPESVIHNLVKKLEPPTLLEAHNVEYNID